jgi:hypothetical protein
MTRWLALAALLAALGCVHDAPRHVPDRPPPPAAWEDVTPDAGTGW